MSECCTVFVEANKISLNVQLDKVANAVLAQVHLQPENNTETHPNANETVNKQHHELKSENTNKTPSKVPRKRMFSMQDKIVVKKYFILWKKLINRKRDMMKMIDQKEKLDNFMKQLRKKRKIAETHTVNEKTMRERSSPENNKEKIQFENRYNAQKTIIEKQKQKLEEQNKVIEELKLGIIREDLYKSLNNIKVDLHEIFSKCSEKIKLHKGHLNLKENREKFMINSQKAPKIVQQMEERAIQRAQNRQLILERKRIIEEHRKRLLEEALEKKRVLEEAEKKKHLQLMAERRKRELELEKLRQSNKERYIYKIKIAEAFYKKILLAQSFRKLVYNCKNNKNNYNLAIQHYDSVIKQRYYYKWFDMVDDLWKLKGDLADALYSHSLLKRVIKIWYEYYFDGVRSMQVAEDLYDLRLTSNTFLNWNRQVCKMINLREKRFDIAKNHYNRKLLVQYFYQWTTLPAVIQLEKAKDLKKRKWREQVSKILPNYRAPTDIF